jgi:hypothetical protein
MKSKAGEIIKTIITVILNCFIVNFYTCYRNVFHTLKFKRAAYVFIAII